MCIPTKTAVRPSHCPVKKQCKQLQSIVLKRSLPTLGLNQNFPRAVIDGPVSQGGLGLYPVLSIQNHAKVDLMLSTMRANTDITKLLQCQYTIQEEYNFNLLI